jgi:capsular polysaccharide biosynthesis protein
VSKLLVDKICSYGASVIADMLGFEQVRVFEEGTVSPRPSNSVSLTIPMAVAALAAILVYAVALLIKISDNKINSAEDVEKHLSLSVLGEIPVVATNPKSKKYY